MKSVPTFGPVLPTLRSMGLAAALACGASASMAGEATLSITSFAASAAEFSGNYVLAMDPYQSFDLTALNGGGLYGAAADSYSADNWNQGANRLAQVSLAKATGNTVQFTDVMTQLATGGFNLGAMALAGGIPIGTPANAANASALQSGIFTLIDGDGLAVAGSITFDIYYDLNVSEPLGSALTYAQTVVSLLSSSDGGGSASFDDGLLSSSLAGGVGATSGHFSWTFDLAAGESAYYTLAGSAIAVAAVPEPGSFVLMGLGIFATGACLRRRRTNERAS